MEILQPYSGLIFCVLLTQGIKQGEQEKIIFKNMQYKNCKIIQILSYPGNLNGRAFGNPWKCLFILLSFLHCLGMYEEPYICHKLSSCLKDLEVCACSMQYSDSFTLSVVILSLYCMQQCGRFQFQMLTCLVKSTTVNKSLIMLCENKKIQYENKPFIKVPIMKRSVFSI